MDGPAGTATRVRGTCVKPDAMGTDLQRITVGDWLISKDLMTEARRRNVMRCDAMSVAVVLQA